MSPTRALIDSRARSAAASLQTARVLKASGHRDLFRTQGGERSGLSDRATRGRRATTDGELRRHTRRLSRPRRWSSDRWLWPPRFLTRGRGPCNGAWPWGGWQQKKPKLARASRSASASLLCSGFSFWGRRPFARLHRDTTPNQTHNRDPGRWGGWLSCRASPTGAPRATRVGRAAGLGIRPTTKKRGRGRGCAWSGPNAGVWARPSGLEYLFVRRPRRRRAEGGEGQRKSRPRPQMPCGRPDRRSSLPRSERPPLALLRRPDHVVPRWLEGPCLHSEGEERLGDVGGGHRQTFDMSGGQTHRFLFRTPGSSR